MEVLLVETVGVGRSPAVRVYLDRPGGVDHQLCARVTGHLRDLLFDYTVEVSSPGPSRPLTKPGHFERFLGHAARVRTAEPIDGRSDFKGELVGADATSAVLAGEWGTVSIPYERIRRANLLPAPVDVPKR